MAAEADPKLAWEPNGQCMHHPVSYRPCFSANDRKSLTLVAPRRLSRWLRRPVRFWQLTQVDCCVALVEPFVLVGSFGFVESFAFVGSLGFVRPFAFVKPFGLVDSSL